MVQAQRDTGETVRAAMALARQRARLERELADATTQRLALVLELRAAKMSHQEVADLLGVSKPRAQQLEREAHDTGLEHDAGACPLCSSGS